METAFWVALAVAIMSSTNAKALSAAILSGIALLIGQQTFLDGDYAFGVLAVYLISHVLSSFRS